jgi:predicted phage replisome organizer
MAEIKWIKLNVDMFDDEKIKIIQSMPEGDSLLVIWIKLITLAGKTNDNGYIYIADSVPYTEEMLSVIMNKPLLTIRLAIETFTNLQMIDADTKGIYLVNFEKHQSLDKMQRIKEQNRLRQAKFKEKKRLMASGNVSGNAKVTQGNATDIDIDKDKDIDKDNKEKINKKEIRHKYGMYSNVLLSDADLEKLKAEFKDWSLRIERLSEYIASTGKVYKNHLATIRSWARKEKPQNKVGANGIEVKAEKSDLEGVF